MTSGTAGAPPRRVCLFAHYDGQSEVKPHIIEFLRQLRECCERIAFVSTAALSPAELKKVEPFCASAFLRENQGYDFGMWQAALRELDLGGVDELLLTNSSVFGPLFPLGPIFERMRENPADFWGMTDNFAMGWHLQSYFLVFKRQVLASPAFAHFFASVLPYRDKWQVVRSYELGLTTFLNEHGFRAAALAPMGCWLPTPERRARLERARLDSTLFFPLELLQVGMPFVKALLLRENPGRVPLEPVRAFMQRQGYDPRLVCFDRPVEPRSAKSFHGVRARLRGF
jgi:lipopolysaccharide biosynthesis protein